MKEEVKRSIFRQSADELSNRVDYFNSIVLKSGKKLRGKIQKIISTQHFICLGIRYPGITRVIYLGRGHGYEGIWFTDEMPPPAIRVRDRYLEYLRKYLKNANIEEIRSDEFDRILIIPYHKRGENGILGIFWKGRKLYFSNTYTEAGKRLHILRSWATPAKKIEYSQMETSDSLIFKSFDEIGRRSNHFEKSMETRQYDDSEIIKKYLEEEKNGPLREKCFNKRLKKESKKESRIIHDLKRVNTWKEIRSIIEAHGFEFTDVREFENQGIKVKLNKGWNHFKKLDAVYQKIKRLKRGAVILEKRLEETRKVIKDLREGNYHVEEIESNNIIGPVWQKGGKNNQAVEEKEKREYDIWGDGEFIFSVGKTAKGNDQLRKEWANREDWWFHIEGYKGAHLVARVSSTTTMIPIELIELVGSALRDYSKLEILDIPLVYTRVKNIRGIKGTSGKVTYKNGRFIKVNYEKNWNDQVIMC